MHIAGSPALLKRASPQTDSAVPLHSTRSPAARVWWREALPGGIVLVVLAILGALFPLLF